MKLNKILVNIIIVTVLTCSYSEATSLLLHQIKAEETVSIKQHTKETQKKIISLQKQIQQVTDSSERVTFQTEKNCEIYNFLTLKSAPPRASPNC
ncbi:hypothetical protein SAMN06265339_0409 [Desulfurobacterium pacificum]|uniref:Uncharacterized protein n=1 Tax=Desulfurobacterium pacificum TaxID=240166 RepID=A0ABY1ND14_9BACT|nr:hypothetical protein [Desulfurobacterium pacificum]SMP06781.1 hypothetical protein SAMN06265339_0409 [Desulfurobacterium pacificum]